MFVAHESIFFIEKFKRGNSMFQLFLISTTTIKSLSSVDDNKSFAFHGHENLQIISLSAMKSHGLHLLEEPDMVIHG